MFSIRLMKIFSFMVFFIILCCISTKISVAGSLHDTSYDMSVVFNIKPPHNSPPPPIIDCDLSFQGDGGNYDFGHVSSGDMTLVDTNYYMIKSNNVYLDINDCDFTKLSMINLRLSTECNPDVNKDLQATDALVSSQRRSPNNNTIVSGFMFSHLFEVSLNNEFVTTNPSKRNYTKCGAFQDFGYRAKDRLKKISDTHYQVGFSVGLTTTETWNVEESQIIGGFLSADGTISIYYS